MPNPIPIPTAIARTEWLWRSLMSTPISQSFAYLFSVMGMGVEPKPDEVGTAILLGGGDEASEPRVAEEWC